MIVSIMQRQVITKAADFVLREVHSIEYGCRVRNSNLYFSKYVDLLIF